MGQYLPIFALLVLAVVFSAISAVASRLLAPRRETRPKVAPYESGIVPGREPPQRFGVRFYLIAMIFIVFDIEIVFLYPWAMAHTQLGVFALVAVAIFAASVFESFLYLLSKGILEWGPVKRYEHQSGMVSAHRTAATTIRRVGTEGRYSAIEQQLLDEAEPPPEPSSSAAMRSSATSASAPADRPNPADGTTPDGTTPDGTTPDGTTPGGSTVATNAGAH
jgi:NADH-quinone oxidoreductase subunit A